MAFLDNVKFNPTAGGTTDWTYSSTVAGYQSPSDAGATNGVPYSCFAVSADASQWELSKGDYDSTTDTFARTTIIASSASNAEVNFSTAPLVSVVGLKEDLLAFDEANSFSTTQQAQARANLGMSSEIGKIEMWPMSDLPPSRLRCDGTSYSRATYTDLFNYLVKSGTATFTNGSANVGMVNHGRSIDDPIKLFTTGSLPTNFTAGTHGLVTVGTVYYVASVVDANTVTLSASPGGAAISAGSAGSGTQTWVCAPHGDGDGSTTFTVPDYRGDFLRGLDSGAGVDTNRSVGSLQTDAMQGHIHEATQVFENFSTGLASGQYGYNSGAQFLQAAPITGGPISDGTHGTPRTAAETRPRNVSVLFTIRYAA